MRAALLVLLLLAVATEAMGSVAGRCQRAIERGSRRYMTALLAAAERCTTVGPAGDIANCLFFDVPSDPALVHERARWARVAARRCAGAALGADLAYHAQCAGTSHHCRFPTPVLDAPGDGDDVLDCLACEMREAVRLMTVRLFRGTQAWTNPADPRRPCVEALGAAGFEVFRTLHEQTTRCLRRRRATSIAACVRDPRVSARVEAAMTAWRAGAVAACAGVSASAAGYAGTCMGPTGVPGMGCREWVEACDLRATTALDAPGVDDDALDCLRCLVEEAGLTVARGVQGATPCCVDGGCGTVMTRAACARASGTPVYYRIDHGGVPGFNLPHGLAFAPDGTMYVADQDPTAAYVATVAPDGTRTELARLPPPRGVPTGLALDAARNAYVPLGCGNQVVYRVAPDGTVSVFAGTLGAAGYAGDGGPATAALLGGGRKTAADAAGNVYVTQSNFLTLACPDEGLGVGEHVRMVDPNGIIHTVAGAGPFGTGGVGGLAPSAELAGLLAMHVTPEGSMVLAEGGLQRVLRIDPLPPAGTVTHVAGRATSFIGSYSGDGGPATLARFFDVEGIVQDPDGNLIVADYQNNRLRLIDTAGSVITIAGNGVTETGPGPGSGDGGPGVLAFLGCPQETAQAPDGRIWFHNQQNTRRFRTLTRVPF